MILVQFDHNKRTGACKWQDAAPETSSDDSDARI